MEMKLESPGNQYNMFDVTLSLLFIVEGEHKS